MFPKRHHAICRPCQRSGIKHNSEPLENATEMPLPETLEPFLRQAAREIAEERGLTWVKPRPVDQVVSRARTTCAQLCASRTSIATRRATGTDYQGTMGYGAARLLYIPTQWRQTAVSDDRSRSAAAKNKRNHDPLNTARS